jgi:glycosyltransferase involved in cell wall biosynthesis
VLHTDINYLMEKMEQLLKDKSLAARLGAEGRRTALERFNIKRFAHNWQRFLSDVIAEKSLSVI